MAENASIIHNVESIKAVLLDIILENKKMINEVNQIKTEMENQRQELNQQTRINRNLHNEIDKLKQELQSQESNFDKSSKQFGNDIRSVELRLNYLGKFFSNITTIFFIISPLFLSRSEILNSSST